MTITTDTEAPEQKPARPSGRRLLVMIAVGLLAAVAVFLWRHDSGHAARSALPQVAPGAVGTVPVPASAPLDAEGQELVGLLQKGRQLTFHATYKQSGDPAPGGDVTIEVWRKGGNIRQDSHTTSGSGDNDTAGFVVGGKATTCSKVGSEPWSCSAQPDPGTNLDGIFGSATTQLSGLDVKASDATVAGRPARCFSFPQSDGTGTICVSPDGLPLQLKINQLDLTLQDESSTVDDSVFQPPVAGS